MPARRELTPAQSHAVDYAHFLADSPTSFHAADLVAQRLVDAGFARQDERRPWDASPGGHVMVRDGAALAWVVPATVAEDAGFRIVGAHTDSPMFSLKPNPSTTTPDGWGQLGVEVYGGMIWNSWLDRELAVAGRVLTRDGRQVLVRTGALARIPQLAIHLDRSVNPDGLRLDPQRHLHPVWTVDRPGADVMDIVARDAGLASAADIAAADLFLVPSQGPGFFGPEGEFLASGRQDDLSSVHAGLTALERIAGAGLPRAGDVAVLACFDHEEVGSSTRSGAAGPVLEDVLRRTAGALGRDADEAARMLAASSCVSSDAGHAVHPNYPDRHDPDTRPVMGRGPMLKINASRRYATDAVGTALWNRACEAAGVAHQKFVSSNAVPCGSTIGPITATRLGVTTVDVGIALLSMHSAREMSHVDDLAGLSRAIEAYWQGA
ncbi:M18 family aminopeptidase [Schaalia naturae]|uniref:M18 family aminopeptidase n=1 Tax=Schaalia naturae TaxID=635203 RepID=UPI00362ACC0A